MHEIETLDRILREGAKKGNKLPAKIVQRIHGMRGNALPQPAPKEFAVAIRKQTSRAVTDQRQVTITDLSLDVEAADIEKFFKEFEVESISMAYDSITDLPAGRAYVDFKARHEARQAVLILNGRTLSEKAVRLEISKESPFDAEDGFDAPDAILILSDDDDADADDSGVSLPALESDASMANDLHGGRDEPIVISDDEIDTLGNVLDRSLPASRSAQTASGPKKSRKLRKPRWPSALKKARKLAIRVATGTTKPHGVTTDNPSFNAAIDESHDIVTVQDRKDPENRADIKQANRAVKLAQHIDTRSDSIDVDEDSASLSEASLNQSRRIEPSQDTYQDELQLVRDYMDMQNAQRAKYDLKALQLRESEFEIMRSNTIVDPEGCPERAVGRKYMRQARKWYAAMNNERDGARRSLRKRARRDALAVFTRKELKKDEVRDLPRRKKMKIRTKVTRQLRELKVNSRRIAWGEDADADNEMERTDVGGLA
jgi:RNA recognition motif-containing protein